MTFEISRKQLIDLIEYCERPCEICDCPFVDECIFYCTGEKRGSQLEQE